MDGAEHYDFFRQPDFVHDPFLKGSYAVYKKETFIGEGTGKLCHIHRPKIIDTRGRWVWGDLSIVGNTLCIIIPERWLAEAAYPVIVDPTIGTTTVGSQTTWEQDPGEDWVPVTNEISMPVNCFLVNETINGLCTAKFYAYSNEEWESGGYPVLYSDNNNVPLTRKSTQENYIDLEVYTGKPVGWRSGTFRSNGAISSGSYIWFGLAAIYFWYVRFDYGLKSFHGEWDCETIPNTYPTNGQWYDNYKMSMYFEYTSAQNYTRTLIQGVSLTDTRKLTVDYKKTLAMNGQNATALGHGASYYREHTAQVKGTDSVPWLRGMYRTISETIKILNPLSYCRDFLRKILETSQAFTDTTRNAENNRTVLTTGGSNDGITWGRGFFRSVLMVLNTSDTNNILIALARNIAERASTLDNAGHLGDYFRGLFVEAGNMAETDHLSAYYRKQEDTAYTEAIPLRSLFMIIRLVTVGLVRDFILKRFLKSNEDIVLKSPVCRDLEIDSCL
ncbi:hypothetical protein FACS189468_5210 [Spirochaetia bacterium]|nr:hypothetical protein FACS189468_5210 [Spirochaetia bacterium]